MSAKDTYGTTKRIEVLNGDLELDAKSESVKILGTENATSASTGALVVDGGAGIAKDLHIGGDLFLGGNLSSGSGGSTEILENTVETSALVVDSIQATCDLDITAGCDITITGQNIYSFSSGNASTLAPVFGIVSNSIDINAISDFDLNSMNRAGITASDLDINATNIDVDATNIDVDGSDIDINSTSSLDISSNDTLNIISGTIEVRAIDGLDIVTGTDKKIAFEVTGNDGAISFKKGSYEIMSIEGSSTGKKAIFNIAEESQRGILIGNVYNSGSIKTLLSIEKEKFISALHFVRQYKDYLGSSTMPPSFVRGGIELIRDVSLDYSYGCNISSFLPSQSKVKQIEAYFEVTADSTVTGTQGLTFTMWLHNRDYFALAVSTNSTSFTFAGSGAGTDAGQRFSETLVVNAADFKVTDRQPNALDVEIYLNGQAPYSGDEYIFAGVKVTYDTFNPCGLGESDNYEDI